MINIHRLNELMRDMGVRHGQLRDAAGVSSKRYLEWFYGIGSLTEQELQMIADKLGFSSTDRMLETLERPADWEQQIQLLLVSMPESERLALMEYTSGVLAGLAKGRMP